MSKILSRKKTEKLEEELIPIIDLGSDIVGWEHQADPQYPVNFAPKRKWLLLMLISSVTFISPLASSMFAPGVAFMDQTFHNSNEYTSAFAVSIYVLGYAFGPLVLAPLCEIYGRRPVLFGANAFFCVWQIGCALAPNLTALIIFRFLAGIGGSGCLTIGGGVIADLFVREQRGLATALYSLGPLFGPVVGPICGGFIAERTNWRWIFWVLFIASFVQIIAIECLNRETNHRVIMRRKTIALRKELNKPGLRSCYELEGAHGRKTVLLQGLIRPAKLLFRSPIVFLLALYMSFVYGLLYLLFTTITGVFEDQYGWDADICGLAYIGIGAGFVAGLAAVAKLSDSTVVRMTKANNGVFEPEMRLPSCVFFACFVPITFFWYGWSVEKNAPWIVPIIGFVPFGFGMIGIFMPIQTYLIDSFPEYAASALSVLVASRSLVGAILPLAAPAMYAKLGLGWGNSLLGFIAVAMIPVPALIYKYGGVIRKKWPVEL